MGVCGFLGVVSTLWRIRIPGCPGLLVIIHSLCRVGFSGIRAQTVRAEYIVRWGSRTGRGVYHIFSGQTHNFRAGLSRLLCRKGLIVHFTDVLHQCLARAKVPSTMAAPHFLLICGRVGRASADLLDLVWHWATCRSSMSWERKLVWVVALQRTHGKLTGGCCSVLAALLWVKSADSPSPRRRRSSPETPHARI
ncbi:hypothetical protein TNCV_3382861 [Trichonephila clavipes]|nr:hypothetical protein TNCV_3382861 [Trichonephila clavipes]